MTNKTTLNHERIKLQEETKLINSTLNWWKNEIVKVFAESHDLDKNPYAPDYNEKMEQLITKMKNLLKKGEFEKSNLNKFEIKLKTFLKKS